MLWIVEGAMPKPPPVAGTYLMIRLPWLRFFPVCLCVGCPEFSFFFSALKTYIRRRPVLICYVSKSLL